MVSQSQHRNCWAKAVRLYYVIAGLAFTSGSSSFPPDFRGGETGLINNSQVSMILVAVAGCDGWSLRRNCTLYLLVGSAIGVTHRPMRNLRVFVAETRLWILADILFNIVWSSYIVLSCNAFSSRLLDFQYSVDWYLLFWVITLHGSFDIPCAFKIIVLGYSTLDRWWWMETSCWSEWLARCPVVSPAIVRRVEQYMRAGVFIVTHEFWNVNKRFGIRRMLG